VLLTLFDQFRRDAAQLAICMSREIILISKCVSISAPISTILPLQSAFA